MLHDNGEVLITAEMHSTSLFDQPQRLLAAGLGPAVAVEVGEQPVARIAMQVDRATEGGL